MIGLGTQDDFAYAQEFVDSGELTDDELTFLWDPNFTTWQAFGVRANSSMALLRADLASASQPFFGFGPEEQQMILDSLDDFA